MHSNRPGSLRQLLLLPLLLLAASCGGGSSSVPQQLPPAVEAEPTGPGRLETAIFLSRVSTAAINGAVRAVGSRTPTLVPVYDVELSNLLLDD